MLILNSLEIREEEKHSHIPHPGTSKASELTCPRMSQFLMLAGCTYHFRRARRVTDRATVTTGTFTSNVRRPAAPMAPRGSLKAKAKKLTSPSRQKPL